MAYNELILEKKGGIAQVIMNRPEARNSLTPTLLAELAEVFNDLKKDKEIRVVFLKGAGKDFCTGMDLKYALGVLDGKPEAFIRDVIPYGPKVYDAIQALDKPVIAAVHGHAIAGGFIMAYFCDLIIATEDASFGDAHAKWGLVPGWQEPQRLARSIGIRRAKQFFLTGETISSKEAQNIGLVWKVVPKGKLEKAIGEWGAKLNELSGISLGMMKQQLNSVMKTDLQITTELDKLIRKDILGGSFSTDALERLKVFTKKK